MLHPVIIIGPAFPLRGGIANFNEALCRSFNEQERECIIVSFTLQYPGFLFPGTTQLAEGDKPPVGLKIIPLINSINPVSWFKTVAYIRKLQPAFLVVRYWLPFMAPALGMIARMMKRKQKNLKIIAICDNIIPHEKRPGDKMLTRFFINSCDAFLVMSESVKTDLQQFDNNKPVVVQPHPVYNIFGDPVTKTEARRQLSLDDNARYILFFGFIREYKGLDILLYALSDDRLRNLNVKLVIAGEFYESREPYIDIIRNNQLDDRVLMHDHYIPKEMVKNYFGAADLVVQPYRSATQSGVTQIAYHFSKPMIVTNVGGLPEMVPHGKAGYVVIPDAAAVADAIFDFYTNNRDEELTGGVKQAASMFTWEKLTSKILELAGD